MPLNSEAKKKIWIPFRNKNCQECSLHEEAQTVCLMGDGPVPAEVMIVGEAPGFREDDVRRPFAGRAGKYLDSVLADFGISRDEVFISNAVKCRPPDNRTPSVKEIKTCRHYLSDEIDTVDPRFILSLGNIALKALTNKSGITKYRGHHFELNDAIVFPALHPAAVLRNPRYEQIFRADIAAFARLTRNESDRAPRVRIVVTRDIRTIRLAIRAILESDRAVAYDFETNAIPFFDPDGHASTLQIAVRPDLAFVVPLHHPESPFKGKAADRLIKLFGNALLHTKAKKVAQNGKFDDEWFHRYGVPLYCDFDTMVAQHLLDENQLKGLKPMSAVHLGVGSYSLDMSKGADVHPLKQVSLYGGKDACYTLQLYPILKDFFLRQENLRSLRHFKLLMMPATHMLTDVERVGIHVDRDRLQIRLIEVNQHVDKLTRRMDRIAGYELNWNSTQQLAKLLFHELKLPVIEYTNGGAESTKESVLLRLRDRHKIIPMILERRKWRGDASRLEGWAVLMDGEGRLHPNYKTTGTVTGRLSSGKEDDTRGPGLNIQQVPRDSFIRSILGAPEGWVFVEADYSQIELRVAAHHSQDPTLMRYYQLGKDVHLQTAMSVTGLSADAIDSETRKKAKAVNFGFLFGMGAPKFVEYARDNYGITVSLDEAQGFRRAFFEEFSTLQRWHERQRRLVRKYKRVQSLVGRVRHLPDVDSEDEGVRAEAERQAINSPVQGLASDMMLLALTILRERVDPEEVRIVGTVHDAGLFEVREDVVGTWVPIIKHTMENLPLKRKFGVRLTVPIVADVKVGKHWGEGEEWA